MGEAKTLYLHSKEARFQVSKRIQIQTTKMVIVVLKFVVISDWSPIGTVCKFHLTHNELQIAINWKK